MAECSRVIQPRFEPLPSCVTLGQHLTSLILRFHNCQVGTEQAGEREALPGLTWGRHPRKL